MAYAVAVAGQTREGEQYADTTMGETHHGHAPRVRAVDGTGR